MSKIIVCYKWVLIEEDIKVNSDLSIDTSKAKGKISDYDRNAIEAAVQIAGSMGDEVIAMTFGDANAEQSLKDALSRGPDSGYLIKDKAAVNADGYVTSNVLAAAIKKINDYKLIICAEGASDTYAHQVGSRLGAILYIPVITNVTSLKVEGEKITAQRTLEDCMETVTATLPVVVTVMPEACEAPIPGLKQVLAAKKKPVTKVSVAELGLDTSITQPKSEDLGIKGYAMSRKNIIFRDGDNKVKVNQLVGTLKKEGVI